MTKKQKIKKPSLGPKTNLRPAGIHKDQHKKKENLLRKEDGHLFYEAPEDINQGWWK